MLCFYSLYVLCFAISEYLDEAMLIPKNTSVLIRRVPGRPRMPIVTDSEYYLRSFKFFSYVFVRSIMNFELAVSIVIVFNKPVIWVVPVIVTSVECAQAVLCASIGFLCSL